MNSALQTRLFQGGVLSLTRLTVGLVKIKVLALTLGSEGVGILSLALQFYLTAAGIVSMSSAVGIINLGRPLLQRGDEAGAGAVAGTALVMQVFNALVFFLVYLVAGENLASAVFGDYAGSITLAPIAAAIILTALASGFCEGVVFLIDRFDLYVRVSIAAAVADAAVFTGGAYLFGLEGALIATLLSSGALLAAYLWAGLGTPAARSVARSLRYDATYIKGLLTYGGVMLASVTFELAMLLSARSQILKSAGAEANGHLQVATAMAAYMQPFIMTGVWGHMHSVVAAHGDVPEARFELERTLRLGARLATAACCAVFVLSDVLVRVVFTETFLPAVSYMAIYFMGECLFVVTSIYGAYLLSAGARRANLAGHVAYGALMLAGVTILVATLGAWAYVVSHVAAATIVAVIAGAYALARDQIRVQTLLAIAMWTAATQAVGLIASWEHQNGKVGITLIAGGLTAAVALWPAAQAILQGRLSRASIGR
jgi:O-antigen/teichoic acid export membrane protein